MAEYTEYKVCPFIKNTEIINNYDGKRILSSMTLTHFAKCHREHCVAFIPSHSGDTSCSECMLINMKRGVQDNG